MPTAPPTATILKDSASPPPLVERVLYPFQHFARTKAAGGIVLLVCTAAALAWANSPWASSYAHLWETNFTVGFPDFRISEPIHVWINDGLMAVFFFLVGLEIKREILVGELSKRRQAALPIAAAAGGMIVPALVYTAFNAGTVGLRGWGIPMATDIAFALGVLALLGERVPLGLKVFLAALAIVDDIGAVLVIALFYTADISWQALGLAGGFLLLLVGANAAGIRHPVPYAILSLALWTAFLASGVHATVAGVLSALTIPSRTRIDPDEFVARAETVLSRFRQSGGHGATVLSTQGHQDALQELETVTDAAQPPLLRFEDRLGGVVAFGIVPLFALSNAGVALGEHFVSAAASPIAHGVVLGLLFGKPIGIALFSWLAVRTGLAALPARTSWPDILGVSLLGGIGFTMSLFIATLAFEDGSLLASAKLGILAGSCIAGIAGYMLLGRALSRKITDAPPSEIPEGVAADAISTDAEVPSGRTEAEGA